MSAAQPLPTKRSSTTGKRRSSGEDSVFDTEARQQRWAADNAEVADGILKLLIRVIRAIRGSSVCPFIADAIQMRAGADKELVSGDGDRRHGPGAVELVAGQLFVFGASREDDGGGVFARDVELAVGQERGRVDRRADAQAVLVNLLADFGVDDRDDATIGDHIIVLAVGDRRGDVGTAVL